MIWVNKVGYYTGLTALSSDANDYSCSTLKTKYLKCKFSLAKEILFIYKKKISSLWENKVLFPIKCK